MDSLEQLLQERDTIIEELRANVMRAQQKMKQATDLKRAMNFEICDRIHLKLQLYRQKSIATRHCEKLAALFMGRLR